MKKIGIKQSGEPGFSLVEVVIAMGIAAVALVSLIGFLPQAMEGASDGADQTAIGLMLEDVHDRIEGAVLKVGKITIPDDSGEAAELSPLFYDQRGVYVDPEKEESEQDSIMTDRFYRVEVELVKPLASSADVDLGEALAVKIDLFWPVDEEGEVLGPADDDGEVEPKSSISYFTAAKTGPGWTYTDPAYEAKIEY